jgi:hypothetical protein
MPVASTCRVNILGQTFGSYSVEMARNGNLFERHRDAEGRIDSAIAIIEAILPLRIDERMQRRFVSNCLWQITQAEGKNKYDLRFRSKASLTAPPKQWRHEHVRRRKDMVALLMRGAPDIRKTVEDAIGCVVTREEHDRLSEVDRAHPEVDGWERYRLAKVRVIDMTTGRPLKFSASSKNDLTD